MTKYSVHCLIFFLGLFASPASDALTVSPLHLTLLPDEGIGVLTVENTRSIPVSFNIKTFTWPESDSVSDLEETDDFLVIPPLFEINPNEKQVVRIALRESLEGGNEHTYRLLIDEVVPEVGKVQGVNFNFQINMPIFVTPSDAEAEPNWAVELDTDGEAELVLLNDGKAHVKVDRLTLSGADNERPALSLDSGGYIFAGERRTWPLDVALSDLKGPLNLTAETNDGSVETVVALPVK